MTKKELIRCALMGEEKAQSKCTDRMIILPCPLCGSKAAMRQDITKKSYHVVCNNVKDMCPLIAGLPMWRKNEEDALTDWNTRPAPPIGRCGECKHAYINFFSASSGTALCRLWTNKAEGVQIVMQQNDFCSYFEPKEEE